MHVPAFFWIVAAPCTRGQESQPIGSGNTILAPANKVEREVACDAQ